MKPQFFKHLVLCIMIMMPAVGIAAILKAIGLRSERFPDFPALSFEKFMYL